MKRAMVAALGVSLLAMSSSAQGTAKPNFAGVWVFDSDATSESAIAAGMQAGAIFGDTFVAEQSSTALTLKISAGALRVTAVYALDGSRSQNMSPPSVRNAQPIEVTSHAKWDAGTLVITSNSQSPSANGPIVVDSTRTMWLDEKGRLVIERVGTPRAMVQPSRSVYRKGA